METMNKVSELIRGANKNLGLLDAAVNCENPVALALAILDQCGYSASITDKVARLLEVV